MDIRDVKACEMALKKLKGNKHARFYLHPVDPVRDKAPKYALGLHIFALGSAN